VSSTALTHVASTPIDSAENYPNEGAPTCTVLRKAVTAGGQGDSTRLRQPETGHAHCDAHGTQPRVGATARAPRHRSGASRTPVLVRQRCRPPHAAAPRTVLVRNTFDALRARRTLLAQGERHVVALHLSPWPAGEHGSSPPGRPGRHPRCARTWTYVPSPTRGAMAARAVHRHADRAPDAPCCPHTPYTQSTVQSMQWSGGGGGGGGESGGKRVSRPV